MLATGSDGLELTLLLGLLLLLGLGLPRGLFLGLPFFFCVVEFSGLPAKKRIFYWFEIEFGIQCIQRIGHYYLYELLTGSDKQHF